MLDQGVEAPAKDVLWAEIKVGDDHLRLFSEQSGAGHLVIRLKCNRQGLGRAFRANERFQTYPTPTD